MVTPLPLLVPPLLPAQHPPLRPPVLPQRPQPLLAPQVLLPVPRAQPLPPRLPLPQALPPLLVQQPQHRMSSTDLLGVFGYNKADGTEKLIAVWSRAPVVYNSTSGSWELSSVTLTAYQKCEFRTFLDYAFMVDGVDANYCYDGSVWSSTTNLADSPKGYYIENYGVRLYLLDVTIGGTRYYSRVWFSDLPKNGTITWGLETGTNLAQTAASAVVTSTGSLFKTRNIKIGDKLTITTGTNAGEYTIQSIDSETQLTLTTDLTYTATNSSFWAGSNWFDVGTDDGDTGKGFGKNSNELLIFKRNSLHRYLDKSNELRKVKGAVGTTARRSIANVGDYTYYYHPTGIYRYGGGNSLLISNPIVDLIEGVTTANQTEVVSWVEDEKIVCFYLGDVTLRTGVTISNCVVSFDTNASHWSSRSYPFPVISATTWLESNVPNVYVGDSTSHVYKLDTGTTFNASPIPFQLETKPYFVVETNRYNQTVNFDRVHLYAEKGQNLSLLYKLYYRVKDQKHWYNDEDWRPMIGNQSTDKSEWKFPIGSRAMGVAFKIIESSTQASFLIEKLIVYFSSPQ